MSVNLLSRCSACTFWLILLISLRVIQLNNWHPLLCLLTCVFMCIIYIFVIVWQFHWESNSRSASHVHKFCKLLSIIFYTHLPKHAICLNTELKYCMNKSELFRDMYLLFWEKKKMIQSNWENLQMQLLSLNLNKNSQVYGLSFLKQ